MRQDTAQDIAGRLYRNLLPFGSGATHKYVLKPAYLDIFIGVFIKLWGKDRRFFEITRMFRTKTVKYTILAAGSMRFLLIYIEDFYLSPLPINKPMRSTIGYFLHSSLPFQWHHPSGRSTPDQASYSVNCSR